MEAPLIPSTSTDPSRASFTAKLARLLRRSWLHCALLILGGFAVHYPSLQGQLVWDDDYLVRENPLTKSPLLIFETFRHHLFLDSSSSHYRPVQNISYCFDYLVWKGSLYGFHITNILLHVGSAVLLYFLLRRILPPLRRQRPGGNETGVPNRTTAAFWIALIWVIHPVHSAAVDYLSGRADSLAALFSCAAWLLYLRGRSAGSRLVGAGFYGAASLSVLLALCSRESAAIWLAIFLLHLFAFDLASRRRKGAVLAACCCLLGAYLALRYLPDAKRGVSVTAGSPAVVRITLMTRALGDYGRLMFFPANLHMDRTVESPQTLFGNAGWRLGIRGEYLSILGLLVAGALAFGSIRKGPMRAMRAFGAAWFALAFLPISNLVGLNATVAEHWLYLPSIGFVIFVFGCAFELGRFPRHIARVALGVALIGFSARTFVRSGDWLNAEVFYRSSLSAGAAKPRMALNLGLILTGKGEYAEAERLLRRVVAIEPDYPIAINALAHLLYREGKLDEANKYFGEAAKVADRTRTEYPRTWIAALNVAHMRYGEHDLAGALAVVQQATHDYAGTWELVSYESELLREMRGPAAALPGVQEFVRSHWW
ncbi:MAG TPA: tetratricopeptide repeat protein, partial [Verrucomicrobiae bacterium]|nr:tetratricopeptide repeat protein [Verrucomicrobiae bacterium]